MRRKYKCPMTIMTIKTGLLYRDGGFSVWGKREIADLLALYPLLTGHIIMLHINPQMYGE